MAVVLVEEMEVAVSRKKTYITIRQLKIIIIIIVVIVIVVVVAIIIFIFAIQSKDNFASFAWALAATLSVCWRLLWLRGSVVIWDERDTCFFGVAMMANWNRVRRLQRTEKSYQSMPVRSSGMLWRGWVDEGDDQWMKEEEKGEMRRMWK